MLNKSLAFFLTVFLAVIGSNANAQRSDSIAAVVNGDVITYTDLSDRLDLVIKSAGMPNTAEFKKRLLPQVLTGLITEQIQIQEANRLNVQIADEEIDRGFADLAGQNNIPPEQFKKILAAQNVSMDTLNKQIKSQIAWGKVIQQEVRPRVTLTEADIAAEIERLREREGQEEYFVAEIFLPVEEDADKGEAQRAISDLSRQLSQDAAQFPAAARQFSQSATAANGGVIGWITPDQLSPRIAAAVQTMNTGSVSEPIMEDEGYTIIFLRDKREINLGNAGSEQSFRIKTAVFELPNDEQARKAVRDDVDVFKRDVKGCLDIMKQVSRRNNADLREYNDIGSAIPANIVKAVETVNIGDIGTEIVTDNSIVVPMLCGREGDAGNIALEREIENRIGTQRLDVLQKRYLRDLVTNAYIERRV